MVSTPLGPSLEGALYSKHNRTELGWLWTSCKNPPMESKRKAAGMLQNSQSNTDNFWPTTRSQVLRGIKKNSMRTTVLHAQCDCTAQAVEPCPPYTWFTHSLCGRCSQGPWAVQRLCLKCVGSSASQCRGRLSAGFGEHTAQMAAKGEQSGR